MKLLAIDTSGPACSVALAINGEVSQQHVVAPREHASRLLPMVASLLEAADLRLAALDGLAFGRGPGSFTGLRIAAGVIQGLALGADLPVAPVSSLAALAQGVYRRTGQARVLAAFDSRMDEVYWGAYQLAGEHMVACQPEQVCPPEQVTLPAPGAWAGAGEAWARYGESLHQALGITPVVLDADALPEARDVAQLGQAVLAAGAGVPAEAALPVYLRDQVTQKGTARG